jgi:hypothetical protein
MKYGQGAMNYGPPVPPDRVLVKSNGAMETE